MDHQVNPPNPKSAELRPGAQYDIRLLTRDFAETHCSGILALAADIEWEYWTRDNLMLELPSKWELSLVAMCGNEPAGYAIVSQKPLSVHLHHLMVGRSHRSEGVGGLLLRQLIKNASVSGQALVTLKVLESNRRAIAFYQRRGFESVARQENGYLQMSRTLADE